MNTRSYPHVKFGSPLFPYEIKNISSLNFTAEWALSPTNKSEVGVDAAGVTQAECVGNVALDIWADADPARAANETVAGIEIMIWFGVLGPAWPLGWDKKVTRFHQQVGVYNLCVSSLSFSPLFRRLFRSHKLKQHTLFRHRPQGPGRLHLGSPDQLHQHLGRLLPSGQAPVEDAPRGWKCACRHRRVWNGNVLFQ